jgi:cobalt-zinc-cadmium efflux system protein
MEAVPGHLDLDEVHREICAIEAVQRVHDLHVWTVTSGYFAMSGHVVVADPARGPEVIGRIHEKMRERFGVQHVTVQVEAAEAGQSGEVSAPACRYR